MKLQAVARLVITTTDAESGLIFHIPAQVARVIVWFILHRSLHLSAIIAVELYTLLSDCLIGWHIDLKIIALAIILLVQERRFYNENIPQFSSGHPRIA